MVEEVLLVEEFEGVEEAEGEVKLRRRLTGLNGLDLGT